MMDYMTPFPKRSENINLLKISLLSFLLKYAEIIKLLQKLFIMIRESFNYFYERK